MANKRDEIVDVQRNVEVEMLRGELDSAHNAIENVSLKLEESMSNMTLMADVRGWLELGGYQMDGPDLYQVQDVSKKLRNLAGLNAHIGRGARLRHAQVWQGGIRHHNVPQARQGNRGVQVVIDNAVNQANFFGPKARERQEKALYTNGQYFVVGEDARPARRGQPAKVKTLRSIPIWQITAVIVNPDAPTEMWAIRRSWSDDGIIDGTPYSFPMGAMLSHEWIYLNAHKDKERPTVTFIGAEERVARNKTLFMEQANLQDGWLWGLPDSIAALNWSNEYRKGVLNGLKMQEALATLAFKLKGQTAASTNAAAAKVSSASARGGTAAMVDGMDVAALSTAGSGYDFDSLRPVLAIVATALDVSVVGLSSDPGAAGSSYGAGQLLDLPTRLNMEVRRMMHVAFEEEILAWLGAPDVEVSFKSMLDGAELYRMMQSILLPYMDGLYSAQEMRDQVDAILDFPSGTVPEGALIPNNAMSLARRDIDTDGTVTAGPTVPAVNQGRGNGGGGDGNTSGNDVRTDTLN